MQDQHVGKHCQFPFCKQLDWLPVQCKHCSNIYCADHSSILSHECPKVPSKKVYCCPLCNKTIPVHPGLNEEECFSIHQATECSMHYAQVEYEKCSKCRTKLNALNKFACQTCGIILCLKHRQIQQHQCWIKAG